MSAPVRVESKVWTDRRFNRAAKLAGYTRRDIVGGMTELWSIATSNECSCVSNFSASDVFEKDEIEVRTFLFESGLARPCTKHDDCIYLCGGDDRLGWLASKRKVAKENGSRGGRPPKKPRNKPTPKPTSETNLVSDRNLRTEQNRTENNRTENNRTEQEQEPEQRSGQAELIIADTDGQLAERLMQAIVTAKPDHALARKWTPARKRKWARTIGAMRGIDQRDVGRIAAAIEFLAKGVAYTPVVESADALRDKFDRIEAAMRRTRDGRPESPEQSYARVRENARLL